MRKSGKAGEIVVIGQDERNVGTTDPSQWWEEQRAVQELLVHPLCHPGKRSDLIMGTYIYYREGPT